MTFDSSRFPNHRSTPLAAGQYGGHLIDHPLPLEASKTRAACEPGNRGQRRVVAGRVQLLKVKCLEEQAIDPLEGNRCPEGGLPVKERA